MLGINESLKWVEASCDCVDSMESSSKNEVVICIKLVEAISKGPIVDKTSSLIDHDESQDAHCMGIGDD